MKRLIPLFLLIVFIPLLWAQNESSMTLTITNNAGFFNYLNASNFDPEQPGIQPNLFAANLQNNTITPIPFAMNIRLQWNSEELFNTYLAAHNPLGSNEILSISNQMLLNSIGSSTFAEPVPSINLSSVMDEHKEFKDAILHTGLLPDGRYTIYLQAVSQLNTSDHYSNLLSIPFEIRNANAIYLQSPGVQLGGMVPTLTNLPLIFIWNSNLTGISVQGTDYGKFTLTIRQFNQVSDLQIDNVENGQIYRVIPDLLGSIYSGYIPFENDMYYAWQISTPLATPNIDLGTTSTLKSPWYVFKFSTEATGGGGTGGTGGTGGSGGTVGGGGIGGGTGVGGTGTGTDSVGGNGTGTGVLGGDEGGTPGGNTPEDEFLIILTNLNNPQVNGLLNDGFRPTGNLWVDDQLYSGNSALQQLQNLAGKTIKSITLSDE